MGAAISGDSNQPRVRATIVHRIIRVITSVGRDTVLRRRLQSGLLWNVIAAVFNQGSTFALALVVANVLGRERFGMYALLQTTILLFANLAQFAMGYTITKYVAEFRSSDKPRAARILAACLTMGVGAGIAASVIGCASASLIADRILGHPELAPYIRIGAPAIGFVVIAGVCAGALAGFEEFRRIGLIGVVSGIIYIGTGAYAAKRWGLGGVIAAIVISYAVQAAILIVFVIREAKQQGTTLDRRAFRDVFHETSVLMSFALPAALAGLSSTPTLWIVSSILARQPAGLAEVALFTAANSIRLIVMFVPYLVTSVGFSVLSNYRGADDNAGFRRAFWTNMAVVTATALAVMSLLIVGSPLVMRAFGRAFVEGRAALVILVAATLPEALGLGFFQVVQTRGRMWTSLYRIALPRDLAIVLTALVLAPRFGAVGAGLSFLLGATIYLFSSFLLVRTLGISVR